MNARIWPYIHPLHVLACINPPGQVFKRPALRCLLPALRCLLSALRCLLSAVCSPLSAAIITSITFSVSPAYCNDMPFNPGERLTFQLKWGVIPAGEAVLEVLPIETLNDSPVYHFVMTAKSYPFLDLFYKVRDRIDSYTDLNLTQTVFYKKKQREGRTKRNIFVRFDWKENKATYTNHNRTKAPVPIKPGCFDPLAVFYYTRSLTMKVNDILERPVTDGKKCVMGQARVIKRETIKLNGNTYDTFLLEPNIKDIGGVFKKSKEAKIQLWITADEQRVPVRIKSKVAVGSFVGELMSATPGSPIGRQR